MKITITVKLKDTDISRDIAIDNSQIIHDTFEVLRDNLSEFSFMGTIMGVQESDSGRWLSLDKSYEEESIYSGMILVVDVAD